MKRNDKVKLALAKVNARHGKTLRCLASQKGTTSIKRNMCKNKIKTAGDLLC